MIFRMKSKPEYRQVFTSPEVYYRVLHIMSTRRYRLPVRRYILDLFEVRLDGTIASTLAKFAVDLVDKSSDTDGDGEDKDPSSAGRSASMSPKAKKVQRAQIVSMFGRGRGRGPAESDDDTDSTDLDSDLGEEEEKEVTRPISLLPVKKIVGFD